MMMGFHSRLRIAVARCGTCYMAPILLMFATHLQFSGFTVPSALHTVGCSQAKFSGENGGISKIEVVSGPRNWCGYLRGGHPVVAVDVSRKYAGKVIVLQSITCLDSILMYHY